HRKERNQHDEEETGGVASRVLAWETQIPEFHPHHCVQQDTGQTSVIPSLERVEGGVSELP
ncbi:hypothetical protein ACQP3L_38105, partial [Escherichia coli]